MQIHLVCVCVHACVIETQTNVLTIELLDLELFTSHVYTKTQVFMLSH